MKKLFLVLAIAASLQAFDAQAQVKSPAAALSAVQKAEATTQNAKQAAKAATWVKYADALMDAYEAPKGNFWLGMSRQEIDMLGGGEKPSAEQAVDVAGRQMTKLVYSNKNLYLNENGQLEVIEVSAPLVDDALTKAFDAYKKAAELDTKGQKTKDISEGLAKVSTAFTDVYNAGFTAMNAGENERAKLFFEQCLVYDYYGAEGEVYSRLADIAQQAGDTAAGKEYLEEGFTKFPQSQTILVGLINYYITSGENTDRLFGLLDEAKKNEPNNASLYYVEGNIHEQLGDGEAALASYRKCAEIDPNYAYGYIGEGIHYYELAVDIQNKAAEELDDAKYAALMGEFETTLKACLPPFEKAFELSTDPELKASIAEYLKNACFRFRTEGPEYQEMYDKYANYNPAAE